MAAASDTNSAVSERFKAEAGSEPDLSAPDRRPSIRLSDIERRARDKRLWEVLPPIDDPYDLQRLSERELGALEEAFADGFGERLVQGSEPLALPAEVESGLLRHAFYPRRRNSEFHLEPDDEDDRWSDEFWMKGKEDQPAPYEYFPLGFDRIRLRIYFRSQFERFCHRVMREDDSCWDISKDEWLFENMAWQQLYQKPWYELHALEFLDWMESTELLKHPNFALIVHMNFAGQLGRLVEQYSWRFRYEGLAITGRGARTGASRGGKARASVLQSKHAKWQRVADEIWGLRPELTKHAVARLVRKKLGLKPTAKNIARYIRRFDTK